MKNQKKIKLIFITILFLSLNNYGQNSNFHIYLCFGQSNMEGQGIIEAQDTISNSRFKAFQSLDCPNLNREKGKWYNASPPLFQCYSKLSPADYFGKTMIANLPDSISIGIINVAVGGCDIRLFNKNIYQNYLNTHEKIWFTNKIKAYSENPYRHLIELAKLAQKDGVIKGILLHQGETNTGQKEWPQYVKEIYNNMLTDLSLNPESTPLLTGELLSTDDNCCSSMNTIINTLPDVIPNAYVISSEGCSGKDNAHFDSAGYRKLGKRYALQMLTIMGYKLDSE